MSEYYRISDKEFVTPLSKAAGVEEISTIINRELADFIARSLATIFNQSCKQNIPKGMENKTHSTNSENKSSWRKETALHYATFTVEQATWTSNLHSSEASSTKLIALTGIACDDKHQPYPPICIQLIWSFTTIPQIIALLFLTMLWLVPLILRDIMAVNKLLEIDFPWDSENGICDENVFRYFGCRTGIVSYNLTSNFSF